MKIKKDKDRSDNSSLKFISEDKFTEEYWHHLKFCIVEGISEKIKKQAIFFAAGNKA